MQNTFANTIPQKNCNFSGVILVVDEWVWKNMYFAS